jgi:hypothetical protein
MRKIIFFISLLLIFSSAFSQDNIIYGSKVIVRKRDTSSAEFQIINSTRNVQGFLKNTGGGNTSFKILDSSDVTGLPNSLLNRYTKAEADARFKAISWVPSWTEVTGKPTTVSSFTNDARYWDSVRAKAWANSTFLTSATFTQNVTLNGPSGIRVGKYTNGQTIPAAGKTLDQFLTDIAIEAVAPTYVQPTTAIASPSGGNYERGTNLGTINLSTTFTQNNAGTSTGNTYAKYISSWNNLGSNTDAVTSLTVPVYYRVTTSYNQGACLNNNLGVQDCTGRVNAGSVTSGNILFNPFDKRYWGFASSQAPSNAVILALSQDNNGATAALSLSSITPSGSQYIVYFTKGTVTSVTVNGIPATGAFTITTYSVTNAQGLTSTYSYVYSNAAQTSTIDSIIFN